MTDFDSAIQAFKYETDCATTFSYVVTKHFPDSS